MTPVSTSTALASAPETELATIDPIAHIDHPSGFFAFAEKNQHFTAPNLPGFVAYREYGKHLVMFGGVNAPPESRRALLEAFCAHAAARKHRPLAVQVRADQAPLFAELGFTTNRLGASYALAIADHGLSGSKRVKMRQKVRRAQKLGLKVVELGVEVPRDAAAFERLRALSAAWLKEKGKPELEFMIGWLGEPEDQRRRIFVVVESESESEPDPQSGEHLATDGATLPLMQRSPSEADEQETPPSRTTTSSVESGATRSPVVLDSGGGQRPRPETKAKAPPQSDSGGTVGGEAPREPHTDRWVGFISYVPVWGARRGWLHDLTRRVSDAPPGTMELCNHTAIERFREEGAEWLHLGFTPFIPGPEPELPEASRFASWVIDKLAKHGKVVYPAQDQVRYKRKWAPTVIESEWIAFKPLSLRAIWDLLRLTRSI